MIPVYDHRGVIGVLGHDGEDPSVLMGRTRGAPSNEWTGRQAFRAAQPSGDSGSLRRAVIAVHRDVKPEDIATLRADLTPAAPSWPTNRDLAHAYAEGHK